MSEYQTIKGRGAAHNPPNRFETQRRDSLVLDWEKSDSKTQFIRENAKSIITKNDSPDIGFDAGINVYRGCEQGCVYCYARPTHEYVGYSAGLDFETKIIVKENAPALLQKALSSRRWRPKVLAMSGVTDPYQIVEKRFLLTRRCIEVLLSFRNPVAIITKSSGVLRDMDLLEQLAGYDAVVVMISITTLDNELHQKLEPRASRPEKRLEALRRLNQAGIPSGVMVAPVIPGLNDREVPDILNASANAGAVFAGMVPLRLPLTVATIFENWLTRHFPERKSKVLNLVRQMRGGELNDSQFFSRMQGKGPYAKQVRDLFVLSCRKAGIQHRVPLLSTQHFKPARSEQLRLFS